MAQGTGKQGNGEQGCGEAFRTKRIGIISAISSFSRRTSSIRYFTQSTLNRCASRSSWRCRFPRVSFRRRVSMKSSRLCRQAMCFAILLLAAFSLARAATGGYHLLKKYTFGAAEGSSREYFDYLTVDSSARRVYLSHGTEVKVVDADNGTLVGNITGLKQDHGIAIVNEINRGFITDG